MNNLEKEITLAIIDAMYEPLHATISQEDAEKAARAIEQRVMPWIEKTGHFMYISGVNDGTLAMKTANFNHIGSNVAFEKWLKDSGLTPTEHPKQKEADQMDEELKRTIKDLKQ